MTEIRKTAADYTPETLQLFDHYVHGRISRRDFLSGVARYATAGMSALAILQSLQPNYALGQQVSPDDPRLSARFQQFDSPQVIWCRPWLFGGAGGLSNVWPKIPCGIGGA